MNIRVWRCPYCGEIRTCPDPGYWTPNTICNCTEQEGFKTEMEELVPKRYEKPDIPPVTEEA